MTYQQLYNFCQDLEPKVSRKTLVPKIAEITGRPKIPIVKTGLDERVCRGFYLSARNGQHPLVRQLGENVIVVSRTLNYCWEKFVPVKELMHVFDDPLHATDSGDVFEHLLTELTGPGPSTRSPQMQSEVQCFWMALGVLCPERVRLELQQQRETGQIDDYAIALRLRIPQQYVPRLFERWYPELIQQVLAN